MFKLQEVLEGNVIFADTLSVRVKSNLRRTATDSGWTVSAAPHKWLSSFHQYLGLMERHRNMVAGTHQKFLLKKIDQITFRSQDE